MKSPPLTLSARIIRMRCGPLRAAIWTAYFPCVIVRYLWEMKQHSRLSTLGTMFIVGIDGTNH